MVQNYTDPYAHAYARMYATCIYMFGKPSVPCQVKGSKEGKRGMTEKSLEDATGESSNMT